MTDYENQLNVQEVIEKNASLASQDEAYLISLLNEISSENKEGDIPYINYKTLLNVADRFPGVLFRHWNVLKTNMQSENTSVKFNTIHLLAHLIKSDKKNRYEEVFESFFELLNDDKLSIAAQAVVNMGLIAHDRPELMEMITKRLLRISQEQENPERQDLMKGYVIEAVKAYIDNYPDKTEIIEFVRTQLNTPNPKLKSIAQRFINEYDY